MAEFWGLSILNRWIKFFLKALQLETHKPKELYPQIVLLSPLTLRVSCGDHKPSTYLSDDIFHLLLHPRDLHADNSTKGLLFPDGNLPSSALSRKLDNPMDFSFPQRAKQSRNETFLGELLIFYLRSSHLDSFKWLGEHVPAIFMRLPLHLLVSYSVGSPGMKVSLSFITMTDLPLQKTFKTSRHLCKLHIFNTDSKMSFGTEPSIKSIANKNQ